MNSTLIAVLVAVYIGIGIGVAITTNTARLKGHDAEMLSFNPFYWVWCCLCALIWPIDLLIFFIEKRN